MLCSSRLSFDIMRPLFVGGCVVYKYCCAVFEVTMFVAVG